MGGDAIRTRTRLKLIPVPLTANGHLLPAICWLLFALCWVPIASGCADSGETAAAPKTQPQVKWPDKNTPEGKFAGRYWLARGSGKDEQKVSTTLQPDMTVLLSIEYRGSNQPADVFKGTWKATQDAATCKFTERSGKPIDTSIVYKFEGRSMISVEWDKSIFGNEPMKFQKSSGGALQMN